MKKSSDSSIVAFTVAGDLMCHSVQFQYAMESRDSFDFRHNYDFIRKYITAADFAMGNLETVISSNNKDLSGYPQFRSPSEYIEAITGAGFDLLFLANNHTADHGSSGIQTTLRSIEKEGLFYTGAGRTNDTLRFFRKEINGISVCILAYTALSNLGINSREYYLNRLDPKTIRKDIQKAKDYFPDVVIVYFHFGEEYQREPNAYQIAIVDSVIKMGADIILAGHSHTLQPVRKFKTQGGRLDSGFVAYSLGNFISNQRWRYSDGGVLLNFSIQKKDEKIYLKDLSFLPIWVYKGIYNGRKRYLILPSTAEKFDSSGLGFLSEKDKKQMLQSFEDTRNTINKYRSIKEVSGN